MTNQDKLVVRGAAIANKPVLSPFEAAVFLGVSEDKIRKLLGDGTLAHSKVGGNVVINRAALLHLITPSAPEVVATMKKFMKGGMKS
jgi:excisionase family DNA binding protein